MADKTLVNMPKDEFDALWDQMIGDLVEETVVELMRTTDRRARVFKAIAAMPEGLICDEVEKITGLPHQTVSARMKELRDYGAIAPNGDRRPTRHGKDAAVHTLTKNARDAIAKLKG
jgi:predicted transcriptional regulator